jgi:hypothetical protein
VRRLGILLAVVALLAGCGGAGNTDEDKIEATIKGYLAAFADHDGDKICSYLTDDARKAMLRRVKSLASKPDCDTIASITTGIDQEELDRLKDAQVADIEVTGNTATARPTLAGEKADEARLRRVGGEWKLDNSYFQVNQ